MTGMARGKGYERSEEMGREKISKLLLRFSGPAILAAETSAFYNLLDAIWVGRLGPEQVAALSVAHPLMHVYTAIGSGIGVGAASLISRNLGAGKKEETNRIVGCSISFFFIVCSIMTIVSLANLETLLRIFGASDAVMPHAYSYMFIETCSIAVDFFLAVLVQLVRVGGSPTLASAGTIISSLTDLVFSPIFVFGLGPFPALGVAGAALGTTVGRSAGVSVLLAYLALGKSVYQFKLEYFVPKLRILTGIYSIGFSQTVRTASSTVSLAIANNVASSFGVVPLAVLGVIFKVQAVVLAVCTGIGQGLLPLVGYNFGAGKRERVGEVVVKAGLISLAWGLVSWVVVSLFPAQIMSLFGVDPDFLAGGAFALRLFALGFFAIGLQNNLSAFFQGIGKATASLVVAASRQLFILVPCLLIMPPVFGLGGLWTAYPISDFLSLALSLAWTVVAFRSLKIPLSLRSTPQAL